MEAIAKRTVRTLLALALLLALVAGCGSRSTPEPTPVPPTPTPEPAAEVMEDAVAHFGAGLKTISADDLFANLNDGDESNDPFILSVRSAEDYGKGHIPGAAWADPKALFTAEGLATLPADQPIVVYCYTGQAASQVTSALNMLGYDASNLVFGMSSWTDDPDVYVKRFEAGTNAREYKTESGS